MKVCPICGKNSAVIDIDLYRCGPCKHTFSDLKPQDQKRYDEDYFTSNPAYFGNPNFRLFDFIHKRLPKGKIRLLEIGCGKGDFLKFMREQEPEAELCGTDLTDNFFNDIRYIKGDFLKEKIEGKFNVIVALAVIEHFDNSLAFIRKVNTLSDGLIFIMTINNDSLIYKVARLLKQFGIRAVYDRFYYYHHLQHFANYSLRKLLESNGFDVLEQANHAYSVRAIEINNFLRFFVWLIFLFSFNCGMLQTVICRKTTNCISDKERTDV